MSTTLSDDGIKPDCKENRKSFSARLKRKLRIGTWNVQTMKDKLDIVLEEAMNYKIDILGIAEHRWSKKGYFYPDAGGTMYYAGTKEGGSMESGSAKKWKAAW